MSRMISGQYGPVFTHSHYEDIEKVYSIWFCTGVSDYKKNTISGISLKNEKIFGDVVLNPDSADLMQGVIVNLGDSEDKPENDILKLMNTLLAKDVSADVKKRVMENDFKIQITEELDTEVSEMCNLSQQIRIEAEIRGEIRGEQIGKMKMAKILHEQGAPYSLIAASAEVTEEVVKEWIALQES